MGKTSPTGGIAFYGLAVVVAVFAFGLAPALGLAAAHPAHHAVDYGATRAIVFTGALSTTALILVGIGLDVSQDWLGALQSSRNTYSLARLQMALWTWLILSALGAATVCRAWALGGGSLTTALDIDINSDLFAVMGISYFTGAAAPAVLSLKSQAGGAPASSAAAVSGLAGEPMQVQGQLVSRPASADPKLGDLVQGDDVGSAGVVDLSKVQQLLITLLLVGLYAAMLFGLFLTGPFVIAQNAHTQFPDFPKTFVGLLALSHGGYLAYKATPKPAPVPGAGPPPPPAGR